MVGGGKSQRFVKGYCIEPTLLADVDNRMTIAQEQIFRPVLVVIPFDDDAELLGKD